MGIYIFTWSKLREYLVSDESDPKSEKDFGKNIIPKMLKSGEKLWPYRFDGYWRDVGTIDSLWQANMDMLTPDKIDLFDRKWPIRSKSPKKPPQFIGRSATVKNSVITEGCEIEGTVEFSVLGNSVTVAKGAVIKSSVLMPGCKIGKDAVVQYSIIGENAVISENAVIGAAPEKGESPRIATVGPDANIAPGVSVAPDAMVYSGKEIRK